MKKAISLLLVAIMFLSLAGCAGAPAETTSKPAETASPAEANGTAGDDNIIKIGMLFPYSGAGEQMGRRGSMGAQYYAEHYFPEVVGGFKNKDLKIELVFGDTQSNAETGVSEFERLVNVEHVDAVVGPFQSAVAAAVAPLAIKYNVPFQVVGASSNTVLSTENDWVFRAGCSDQFEAACYIDEVDYLSSRTEGGIKDVAIIHTSEDFGTSGADTFEKILEERGYNIIVRESIEQGVADMSGIVQKLKASDADLCMVFLTLNEAILFYRQLREYNVNIPIFGKANGLVDPSFIEAMSKEAEYCISGCVLAYDAISYLSDADQAHVHAMEEEFELDCNETCAMGWLAMGCLLECIDNAASTSTTDISAACKALKLPGDHPANLLTMYPEGVEYGTFGDPVIYNQNIHSDIVPFIQLQDGYWKWIGPSDIPGVNDNLVWPVPDYRG